MNSFIQVCLRDFHDNILNDAKYENKEANWNIADFMDYAWSRDERFNFDADTIAVAVAYGSGENERLNRELALWKAKEEEKNGPTIDLW